MISVRDETIDEINRFHDYLKVKGYGYWHRAGTIWLITTSFDSYTAEEFRSIAEEYFPNKRMVVINLQDNKWAGFGTAEEFKWFHDNWL